MKNLIILLAMVCCGMMAQTAMANPHYYHYPQYRYPQPQYRYYYYPYSPYRYPYYPYYYRPGFNFNFNIPIR